MLFVTTQSDSDYYVWQTEVQLSNFKKFAIEDKIIVVFGYNPIIGINPKVIELRKKTFATILFYEDSRTLSTRIYPPSIKSHLMKKLFAHNSDLLKNQDYLYLDSDIIITHFPNLKEITRKKVIHVSDTTMQMSFDKLKKMNLHLFNEMCKSIGINNYTLERNKKNGGGIMFFFKKYHHFYYDFWDKVEKDSNSLYKLMLVSNDNYRSIELVTANKWAILWNIWLMGYDTEISDKLSVCWATNPIEDWNKYYFYNNAGVNEKDKKFLFYKSDYIEKSPYNMDLSYVSDRYCSFNYVREILDTLKTLK